MSSIAISVPQTHNADFFLGSRSSGVWDYKKKLNSSSIIEPDEASEQNRIAGMQEQIETQRLHHYLEASYKTKEVEAKTATLAMEAWRALSALFSNQLPVPDAGIGPDGQLLYTWNKSEHHFELEIFPDGHGEFFYLNRQTDEMWDNEYTVGDSIPDEAKEKLREFFLYD